jgi:hypothetical protein
MRRVICLAAILNAAPALASPYTLSKGSTAVTLMGSVWSFDSFFDGSGGRAELPYTITQTDLILGLEHGLTDRMTLTALLPYSRSERAALAGELDPIEVNDGASDLRLGLRWRLSGDGATQYGLVFGVKWPGDYTPDVINAPGDGNFDAEILATAARQLGKLTISADGGFRYRNGNPANEIVLRLEPSYLLGTRIILFGGLEWIDSLGGIPIEEISATLPFSRIEEDLLQVSSGAFYSFSQRFGAFAAWSTTLDGRSTARGSRWTLGTRFSF